MRIVIQRVSSAKVEVGGELISSIGRGLFVLIGISRTDAKPDADFMRKKILKSKYFEDESKKLWSKSVVDLGLELLLVSQFTLYANLGKGNRPDFHRAMPSAQSRDFYEQFVEDIRKDYDFLKVKTGKFGHESVCTIVNEGPCTIQIDSRDHIKDPAQSNP
ncbi:D-aminoacyl-tRNA deacylase-like [Schistocerca gregaria]|uniref:D-aminoacyl-tRNA deacylase-like n=1 Tax=Schistocerca gregaria TaxID=7010 RepID=UPI00211F1E11|nr:D-aminoacyl-tRNA deacylase-like [Schistocerca gregaria]